jgi:AcrR family transcriptional regulator
MGKRRNSSESGFEYTRNRLTGHAIQSYDLNERMNDGGGTKNRILDSSEKLFGLRGFEGVSLRDITTDAGVNLASINYHFQTKEALIDAVIARRIEPVNQRRYELLEALGPEPTVEQIVESFLRPALEKLGTANLGSLMGRVMANPDLFVDRIFKVHFAPLADRFISALSKALPDLPLTEVIWRFHFMIGIMSHQLLWGGVIERISNGLCSMKDREALLQRTVQFAAAGFKSNEK